MREPERRCGLRLRQVRRTDLPHGTYDVTRLADSELGIAVPAMLPMANEDYTRKPFHQPPARTPKRAFCPDPNACASLETNAGTIPPFAEDYEAHHANAPE